MNKNVEDYFSNKLQEGINIIKKHNLKFWKVGLFGSYARGSYKTSSDIDIVMIFEELPERKLIAELKCDLDDINIDFAVLLKSSYENPSSAFSYAVARDFKEITINE